MDKKKEALEIIAGMVKLLKEFNTRTMFKRSRPFNNIEMKTINRFIESNDK